VGYQVSQSDSHGDAVTAFISKRGHDAGVFGEEESAVGEDADLVLGRLEEPGPGLARHGPAVRIDGSHLFRPQGNGERSPAPGHSSASSASSRSASAARLLV
jgi:hypothetical protein